MDVGTELFVLLVACLAVSGITLGLVSGVLLMWWRGSRLSEDRPSVSGSSVEDGDDMTTDERIADLARKLERWREEDRRRANESRYQNLTYILWGFALASTGLAASNRHGAVITIAILFWLMGFAVLGYSAKFRKKKQ